MVCFVGRDQVQRVADQMRCIPKLSQRVLFLRHNASASQMEFAFHVGIDRHIVGELERDRPVSYQKLYKFAQGVGLPVPDLCRHLDPQDFLLAQDLTLPDVKALIQQHQRDVAASARLLDDELDAQSAISETREEQIMRLCRQMNLSIGGWAARADVTLETAKIFRRGETVDAASQNALLSILGLSNDELCSVDGCAKDSVILTSSRDKKVLLTTLWQFPTFSERVQYLARELGWDGGAIAQKVGVGISTVGRMKRAQVLQVATVARFAQAFEKHCDISPAELVHGLDSATYQAQKRDHAEELANRERAMDGKTLPSAPTITTAQIVQEVAIGCSEALVRKLPNDMESFRVTIERLVNSHWVKVTVSVGC
jgi:transcriptional regulator with XRE-family HTH domain